MAAIKSIEEKAKAYDEAIERAKVFKEHLLEVNDKDYADEMDYIFPELKESEDEKIRKVLLNDFKNNCSEYFCEGINRDMVITWLEKQGEHKKFRDSIQVGDKVTKNEDGVLVNLSQLKRVAKKDEKQGKQSKNEDKGILHRFSFYSYKDEPNILYLAGLYVDDEYRNKGIGTKILKVANEVAASMKCNSIRLKTEKGSHAEKLYRENGYTTILEEEENQIWLKKQCEQKPADKVEPKFKIGDFIVNDYCIGRIVEITNDAYLLDTEQGIPFSCHSTRLWDVTKDAKEGDVLVVNNEVFIYAHRKQMYSIAVAHCFVDSAGGFYFDGEFGYTENGNSIHPATEEQRELLFQKMKEEGYEWDAEKKELKKIEQPKQEWSEEDDRNIDWLITVCERIHYKSDPQVFPKCALMLRDWLKSIKERYTWKPSDVQIECLSDAIKHYNSLGYPASKLKELLDDLKKLKG